MQRILQPGEIEALDRVSFPRVRLPQPATLFQDRAARLRQLAEGDHPIADYLRFAARLVDAQHRLAAQPAALAPPGALSEGLSEEHIARASANGMPLLSPAEMRVPAWRDALRALLADVRGDSNAGHADVPAALDPVLERLGALDDAALDTLAGQVLADNIGREDLAAAPFIAAALQVVSAQRAATLDARQVPFAEPATVCPVCGSAPVASVLRIGGAVAGQRYLHCGLCETEWHMVRIKCSHCESTEGVRYQGIEENTQGEGATDKVKDQVVLAETCTACHTYRKFVNQEKDPYAEPLADDLASLTLDLLMGETPFARASSNPLLAIEKPLAV